MVKTRKHNKRNIKKYSKKRYSLKGGSSSSNNMFGEVRFNHSNTNSNNSRNKYETLQTSPKNKSLKQSNYAYLGNNSNNTFMDDDIGYSEIDYPTTRRVLEGVKSIRDIQNTFNPVFQTEEEEDFQDFGKKANNKKTMKSRQKRGFVWVVI